MSVLGLVFMSVVWTGILWLGAEALCRLRPTPKQAQAIWRAAAAFSVLPFVAALFMPAMRVAAPGLIQEAPMMDVFMVTPDAGGDMVLTEAATLWPSVTSVVLAVLIAGWAARGVFWMMGQWRLRQVKASARASDLSAAGWARQLGLKRAPDVKVLTGGTPFVTGLLKPVIYVPEALAGRESALPILAHECVHLARGDLKARPFERLVADVFWFSPFAWGIRSALDYWREAVVDEDAARLTGDKIAYAKALTEAARFARPIVRLPVAAFILSRKGSLKMRLTDLLTETPRRPKRFGFVALLAGVIAVPLALAQGAVMKGDAVPSSVVYSHAVLDKAKLTSAFGARFDPISGEVKVHQGVDLAEEIGKPVYAPADGLVQSAAEADGYGKRIDLALDDETIMRFAQLSEMLVEEGDQVRAGDVIGKLGMSGRATGPHLHLELWRGKTAWDPEAEEGLVLANALRIMPNAAAWEKMETPLSVDAEELSSPEVD